ncbi:hypothetical protein ACFFNA_39465, partial [Mesorhizobium kowhaii]
MAAWVLVHLPHPGPFPFHVAFVDDRLLCAVNPRWGYTRRIFRKIRFLFFVRGQAKGLPAIFWQIEFSRIFAEMTAAGRPSPLAPSGMVPMQPKENY